VNYKRLGRDRVGLFFVFVFPIVLILMIGVSFGGGFTPKLGLLVAGEGPLSDELANLLSNRRAIDVEVYEERSSLDDAVERGFVQAGAVIPGDYDAALRSTATADVVYVNRPGDVSSALRTAVESAVTEQGARVRAARFASQQGIGDFDEALDRATFIDAGLPKTTVTERVVGDEEAEGAGQFGQGASSQLVLFVFLNSLAGCVALIQVRRLGLTRRMLSTPTSAGSILIGEGLGRFLIAMVQALFIVVAARLLFDVDWGDPLGSGAIIVAFSLVAAGAAMLFGAVLSNENQAGALIPVALAMAALGGSMVPLEVFPSTMRTLSKITPHAWANDAFNELLNHGGTIADVSSQLAVLLGYAVVLLAAATWGLRRSIVR